MQSPKMLHMREAYKNHYLKNELSLVLCVHYHRISDKIKTREIFAQKHLV